MSGQFEAYLTDDCHDYSQIVLPGSPGRWDWIDTGGMGMRRIWANNNC